MSHSCLCILFSKLDALNYYDKLFLVFSWDIPIDITWITDNQLMIFNWKNCYTATNPSTLIACLALSARAFSHIHMHPFNGPLSRATRVSRYQKGKTNLDFTEARDSEWQWHHLGHMQVCILLQTDNHTSTPPLCFFRPDALPAAQPTASKHWRQTVRTFNKVRHVVHKQQAAYQFSAVALLAS